MISTFLDNGEVLSSSLRAQYDFRRAQCAHATIGKQDAFLSFPPFYDLLMNSQMK